MRHTLIIAMVGLGVAVRAWPSSQCGTCPRPSPPGWWSLWSVRREGMCCNE